MDDRELLCSIKVGDPGLRTTKGLGQYLPECHHGSILMTTRDKKAGSDFMYGNAPIEIGPLSSMEAITLIQRTLGDDCATVNESLELSRLMEGLPLAIAQALAFISSNSMTIGQYIRIVTASDDSLVELLSQHFETLTGDPESPNAVAASWMISFRKIEAKDSLAGELMSLMSMFDWQNIPRRLIDLYLKGKGSTTASLGTLVGYAFVRPMAEDTYDMHRLVRLVARKWLKLEDRMANFAARSIGIVYQSCPPVQHETMDEVMRLIPHIRAITSTLLSQRATDETKRMGGGILVKMGWYYIGRSQFQQAQDVAEEAYRLLKDSFGSEDEGRLVAVELVLEVYNRQGLWSEGVKLGEKERRLAEEAMGKEHVVTLRITRQLGELHLRQNNPEEAEKMLLFVSEAFQRKYGDQHHQTLSSRDHLATVYRERGLLKEALDLRKKMLETPPRLTGRDHPDTLARLSNLACVLEAEKKFEEAEKIFAEVAEIKERTLGPEHHSTIQSLEALAVNRSNQGNFEPAEKSVAASGNYEVRRSGVLIHSHS